MNCHDAQGIQQKGRESENSREDQCREAKSGKGALSLTEKQSKNFWRKVNQNGPTMRPELTPCWIWTANKFRRGYGSFSFNYKATSAHRISFQMHHRILQPEEKCLHKCDNPPCVNPDHLFAGTDADNIRDRDQKGRTARGERHGSFTKPGTQPRGDEHYSRRRPELLATGERHHSAKLSNLKVVAMRQKHAEEHLTFREIGDLFGVSGETAQAAITRKTWKHVK